MREEKIYEVNYGYWFNLVNERAYHHLDVVLNLVQLVGGSAAALAALQGYPSLVVASGLALALCAALSLLVQPGTQAERHRACKAQWATLRGQAARFDDEQLDDRIADIQSSGPSGLGFMADVAYNATLRATGQDHALVKLSRLQRLAAAFS